MTGMFQTGFDAQFDSADELFYLPTKLRIDRIEQVKAGCKNGGFGLAPSCTNFRSMGVIITCEGDEQVLLSRFSPG